ncbi:hypothetical protein BEP19_12405 [Ammoniphilus oxalaticus]|uniref:DUF1934 domain-containing protein n=1 Tax=Ammoniphilus oxalaticus TaxID=66863 RepID=A0A419SGV0_9BACL|nr:DUF1934 domain-containing protein [Ammoniphilus oxalaticus]RKD23024.1 hypothetical protein BEP19_12405 [Ammoniphilus oxalaticus]
MKQVKINIQTNMRQQGQSLEQICQGKFFARAEGWNLVYQEDLGDNQKVSTTVKLQNGMATITRTGAVRMRQEFKPGQTTKGNYQSPYGLMQMETKTDEIRWEDRQFFLSYRLKLNGDDMGRYEVTMEMEDYDEYSRKS